jgi:hypothetical protein
MKYIIYEMVTSNALTKLENSDMYDKKDMIVLTPIEWAFDISREHPTYESAQADIEKYAEKLKYKTLTILPVFDIDYNGKIRS